MRLRRQARATVALTFDNLGEVTALQRGEWPEGAPLGEHWSVTESLPRILAALAEHEVEATFFVEGLNAELYPDTLREIAAAGHEVGLHGWRHEPWSSLEPARERELLERGVEAFDALGLRPVSFRPPGGDLTPASLDLLRELRFEYVSPAGDSVSERDGLIVMPFRWEHVDAWYYLPKFDGPDDPAAWRAAVQQAGDATLVFHPFLLDTEERFAVLLEALAH
ncbi:MAG TPA: polysaccharide deacetylase family protein [Solirubrobacteraceae bacterium]|nr:polysaccharide deacetylase family protein [Solirubrobacteraceae bacterium]